MRTQQMTTVLAVFVIMAMIIGCATMPFGPTPTEEVAGVLADYQTAWKAQDVEKVMSLVSDNYSNSQGLDKPALRGFFEGLAAQGVLQSVTMSTEECKIVVDGDIATAGPVIYDPPTISYSYKFKKEADGVWRIVNAEAIQ
jgi:ketosteroid isomerase-like protein